MTLKQLKKGDFFTKKPLLYPKDSQVWIKGDYDRASRRYSCTRFDDINTFCLMKGEKEVFTDLIF